MIRRICMVCGVEHSPPIDDGRPGAVESHGYCERHYDEAMLALKDEFAELPADGARAA
jgi:hypothetical protein